MHSSLTADRPDIWHRGLALATSLTGYAYAPKVPLADGTIYACGDPASYSNPETLEERIKRLRRTIANWETIPSTDHMRRLIDFEKEKLKEALEDLKKRNKIEIDSIKDEPDTRKTAPRVFVPDGAMEWLLHEVGHYLAASPEERARPNYGLTLDEHGHDGEREWQAWAFQEIVLAPFGPARHFAPPAQRDGAAFSKNGPIEERHLAHIERQIEALDLDVEEWRAIYGEWIRWGMARGHGRAPWEMTS